MHDFKYISKKDDKVRNAYENLKALITEVQKELRDCYTFQYNPVGSYKRNMITYDTKSNIGFDFDIDIKPNTDAKPKEIKQQFRNALNKHAKNYGFDYPEDSTRVLTIKVKDRKQKRIVYGVDFAFLHDYSDDEENERQEYIRFNKNQGSYTWEEQPYNHYTLQKKIDWIKEKNLWEAALKPYYIEKKNENIDTNLHSRSIFAIAVHEICQKYGYYENESE